MSVDLREGEEGQEGGGLEGEGAVCRRDEGRRKELAGGDLEGVIGCGVCASSLDGRAVQNERNWNALVRVIVIGYLFLFILCGLSFCLDACMYGNFR